MRARIQQKNKIKNLKIVADITSIGESAFAGCTGLNKVWLPSTLENIGVNAFNGCTAITHIGCNAVGSTINQRKLICSNN